MGGFYRPELSPCTSLHIYLTFLFICLCLISSDNEKFCYASFHPRTCMLPFPPSFLLVSKTSCRSTDDTFPPWKRGPCYLHRSEGSIVRNGDLAEERKAQLGLKDNKIKETENEVGGEQAQIGRSLWIRDAESNEFLPALCVHPPNGSVGYGYVKGVCRCRASAIVISITMTPAQWSHRST